MSSDRWHHAGEPEGFSMWLAFHASLTGTDVPAAGSDRRADLEQRFNEALQQGYTVEQIRNASRAQVSLYRQPGRYGRGMLPEGAFAFLPPAA